MTQRIHHGLVSLLVASLIGVSSATAAPEVEDLFETVVRPLLATRCAACHGATTQWA